MSIFDYKESIISIRRKGDSSDPYIPIGINRMIKNGLVQLPEIPSEFDKVQVTGNGQTWFEIKSGIPVGTQYKVSYLHGYVEFDPSNDGKTLSFSFRGTGNTFISADRVWVEYNGVTVTKTLQDVVSLASGVIDNVEQIYSSIETAKTLKVQLDNDITAGTTLKNQLENDISVVSNLKTELEASIDTAKKTKISLDTSNTAANNTKSALDASNSAAANTNTALSGSIASGNSLKETLEHDILAGLELQSDLEVDIPLASSRKDELENAINNATASKSSLENTILESLDKKGTLDASISTAIEKQTSLDDTVSRADTLNESLNTHITTGSTLKTDLTNRINEGTTLKNELEQQTLDAYSAKTDLDKSTLDANTSKTNLDESIIKSAKSKTDLDGSIGSASTSKTNLDSSITTGNELKENLDASISRADNSKANLDNMIQDATDSKISLEESISLANSTKNIIDGSVENGQNKIQEMDSKIAETNKKLTEVEQAKNDIMDTDLRLQFFEAFDSSKSYKPLNKVSFDGSSYVCIKECVGILPTNPENWLIIAKKGMDGDGSGTVTSVTSANEDISITDSTSTPVIKINVGTGANQIVKRDSNGGIKLVGLNSNFTATDVDGALNELFSYVSDGKNDIATAITGMGQNASGSDTFVQLSKKIESISNDATAQKEHILSGKTAYTGGEKVTGSMQDNGYLTINPTNEDQPIPAGYISGGVVKASSPPTGTATPAKVLQGETFMSSASDKEQIGSIPIYTGESNAASYTPQTGKLSVNPNSGYYVNEAKIIVLDENFKAENIKKDTTVLGIMGSYDGVNPTGTAQPPEVIEGKTFSNDQGIDKVGTMKNYSGQKVDSNSWGVGYLGNDNYELYVRPKDGYYDSQSEIRPPMNVYGNDIDSVGYDPKSGELGVWVPPGYFIGDTKLLLKDPNYIIQNIKNGKSIFGLVGNYEPRPAFDAANHYGVTVQVVRHDDKWYDLIFTIPMAFWTLDALRMIVIESSQSIDALDVDGKDVVSLSHPTYLWYFNETGVWTLPSTAINVRGSVIQVTGQTPTVSGNQTICSVQVKSINNIFIPASYPKCYARVFSEYKQ